MMSDDNIKRIGDAAIYIHKQAIEEGTRKAYVKAIDELQGVWVAIEFLFDGSPYCSIALSNLQRDLKNYVDNEELRKQAKRVWRDIQKKARDSDTF